MNDKSNRYLKIRRALKPFMALAFLSTLLLAVLFAGGIIGTTTLALTSMSIGTVFGILLIMGRVV